MNLEVDKLSLDHPAISPIPLPSLRLPKRIGLRSNIRLSGVAGKNVLDYVTRRFNASSAGLKTGWGA
jgi:hypothetical protein